MPYAFESELKVIPGRTTAAEDFTAWVREQQRLAQGFPALGEASAQTSTSAKSLTAKTLDPELAAYIARVAEVRRGLRARKCSTAEIASATRRHIDHIAAATKSSPAVVEAALQSLEAK